jgi:uncharacterized membrane protein
LENSARKLAMWGWIAFLVGWFLPLAPFAGVIIGYVGRGNYKGTAFESDFKSMVRVFWWTFIASVVSVILTLLVIGYLGLLLTSIYVTVKAVKGIIKANNAAEQLNHEARKPDVTKTVYNDEKVSTRSATSRSTSNDDGDIATPIAAAAIMTSDSDTTRKVDASEDSGTFS